MVRSSSSERNYYTSDASLIPEMQSSSSEGVDRLGSKDKKAGLSSPSTQKNRLPTRPPNGSDPPGTEHTMGMPPLNQKVILKCGRSRRTHTTGPCRQFLLCSKQSRNPIARTTDPALLVQTDPLQRRSNLSPAFVPNSNMSDRPNASLL